MDISHLSLSSLTSQTCIIWRVDGTQHYGPRLDYNGFTQNMLGKNVKFGDKFFQLGYWRIGAADQNHLTIGTETLVSQLYRSDGTSTIHNGPRMDYRVLRPVTKVF